MVPLTQRAPASAPALGWAVLCEEMLYLRHRNVEEFRASLLQEASLDCAECPFSISTF